MPSAEAHMKYWAKSGQVKVLDKILDLLRELEEHPRTGTGQVEQLKGNLNGYWSSRINKFSRMVYCIDDEEVTVIIVSVKGHYTDL